jgi:hypothetical protein
MRLPRQRSQRLLAWAGCQLRVGELGLFDHLVGAREHGGRYGEPERLGGPEVDNKLDLRDLLDRQMSGLLAFENAASVYAGLPVRLPGIAP